MCFLMHLIGHWSACQIISHSVVAAPSEALSLFMGTPTVFQTEWSHWEELMDFIAKYRSTFTDFMLVLKAESCRRQPGCSACWSYFGCKSVLYIVADADWNIKIQKRRLHHVLPLPLIILLHIFSILFPCVLGAHGQRLGFSAVPNQHIDWFNSHESNNNKRKIKY